MSKYIIIKSEIDNNAGLYGAMSDTQVAAELNSLDKPQNKVSMTRQDIVENIDADELNSLTSDNLNKLLVVLSDSINPFGVAQSVFINVFGGGSTTISNLAAARVENISRASQIGLGIVAEGDVTNARNQ